MMRSPQTERPCIHVSLGPGVDPDLYRWVEVGAEEEGVPCCRVDGVPAGVVELAYGAAQSSRLNIGVGIGEGAVALHEQHMPPGCPVLVFAFEGDPACACRRMGANAARLVVHRPLLLAAYPPAPPQPELARPVKAGNGRAENGSASNGLTGAGPADWDPGALAYLVKTVIRKVHERGIL